MWASVHGVRRNRSPSWSPNALPNCLPIAPNCIPHRPAATDPRVLVISYEELKREPRACIGRVNAHCGFGLSDARLDQLLPQFSFEWMRSHESQFQPRSVRWVRRPEDSEEFHFIRAGRVGDGAKAFSPAQRELLGAMLARTFGGGEGAVAGKGGKGKGGAAAAVPASVAQLVA